MDTIKTIHAVFESGIFRPLDPVELPESCEFEPRPVTPKGMDDVYRVLDEAIHPASTTSPLATMSISREAGVS